VAGIQPEVWQAREEWHAEDEEETSRDVASSAPESKDLCAREIHPAVAKCRLESIAAEES